MIFRDLALLFTGMGLPAAVCLGGGLILCVSEIFNSFRGRFASLGAPLALTGVILRLKDGGTAAMFFWILFFIAVIIVAAYLVMIRLRRYIWLSRTPSIQGGDADEESLGRRDYYHLLGCEGLTLSELCPYGKISVNNAEVKAVAKYGALLADTRVKVIEVEGSRVIVAEAE